MNAPQRTPTPSEAAALARAALCRLVALGFCEPDAEWLGILTAPATHAEANAAAATLGVDPADVRGMLEVSGGLPEQVAAFARLFGHTVRSACPPYELEYGRSEIFQQAHALADLAGFYAALGLEPAGPLQERPDHVAAEWEFLALASQREAAALAENACDAAAVLADMQQKFLTEHAVVWMPAFCNRVVRADAGFYNRLARLARALLDHFCAVRQVSPGEDWLELRPTSPEDAAMTCGAPDSPGGQVELGPWMSQAGAMEFSA